MKPAKGFDITSLVLSNHGSKGFRSEVENVIKYTINGANPPQPAFISTKESRFASNSTLSTPSNPNLGSIHTPIINTQPAIVKFTDDQFHPEISIRQAMYTLGRSMSFVFNSRQYKWKWGLWAPSKLVMDEGSEESVVGMFYLRWGFQLSGVMSIDGDKIHPSVAYATILVCMKRERERRHL